jgi:hypothetical protein
MFRIKLYLFLYYIFSLQGVLIQKKLKHYQEKNYNKIMNAKSSVLSIIDSRIKSLIHESKLPQRSIN